MRPLTTGLIAASLVIGLAGTVPAQTAMTDAERTAFRAEVRTYLLENPEILSEMVALLEERQQTAAAVEDGALVAAEAEALFDDGFSHVGGNPDGDVTIVEFLDYQCSFCRRAHDEIMSLLAGDGNLRWIVKELPILGPASETASRAAIATLIAAGPEAYAVLNDHLMRLDGPVSDASLDAGLRAAGVDPATIRAGMDDPEIDRRLAETRELAQRLSIQGTPSFVFGDRMVRGYVTAEVMRDLVEDLRTIN
jgi:protein-disulfide isomerase